MKIQVDRTSQLVNMKTYVNQTSLPANMKIQVNWTSQPVNKKNSSQLIKWFFLFFQRKIQKKFI